MPPYIAIILVSVPMSISYDFFVYFLCVESISVLLVFAFLCNSKEPSVVSSLYSLFILNFLNFILFVVFYMSVLYLYGTSDLNYIYVLYNGGTFEVILFVFGAVSLFIKIGQIPSFFYKINIYFGMPQEFLFIYISVYTAVVTLPSIFFIYLFLAILGISLSSYIFIFIFLLNIFLLFFSYNITDFLAISSSLFTSFLLVFIVTIC